MTFLLSTVLPNIFCCTIPKFSTVRTVTLLGLNLDTGLTCEYHIINNVCNKIASDILGLRKLSSFSSPKIRHMACYGLILPHFMFGITFWGICAHRHFNRVFILQNKAIGAIRQNKLQLLLPREFKTYGHFDSCESLHFLDNTTLLSKK